MNGPQDNHELLSATFQAFCAAVAMFAKREMIVRLARSPGNRRPPLAGSRIPSDKPSIGLYIIIILKTGEQVPLKDLAGMETAVRLLMKAFPHLRDVVYFIVGQEQFGSFEILRITKVYSRGELFALTIT